MLHQLSHEPVETEHDVETDNAIATGWVRLICNYAEPFASTVQTRERFRIQQGVGFCIWS